MNIWNALSQEGAPLLVYTSTMRSGRFKISLRHAHPPQMLRNCSPAQSLSFSQPPSRLLLTGCIQRKNQEDGFYENHALKEGTTASHRPRGNVSRSGFVTNHPMLTMPYRYQPPLVRSLSKSAKARARRRQKKAAAAVESMTVQG